MSDINEKNARKLGYLEKYARGSVILDTRDEYHANLAFIFDQFNVLKAENASLITTIESLQGELKAADDHEKTLKRAFHVRQSINEKELYDKNKIIESQKEEIKRLSTCQDCGGTGTNELCHDPYYVVPCICTVDWYSENMELRKQIESLKAITELAVKGLKAIACLNVDSDYSAGTIARNTFSEIERLSHE